MDMEHYMQDGVRRTVLYELVRCKDVSSKMNKGEWNV